jgi:hypothetical protein
MRGIICRKGTENMSEAGSLLKNRQIVLRELNNLQTAIRYTMATEPELAIKLAVPYQKMRGVLRDNPPEKSELLKYYGRTQSLNTRSVEHPFET